jgi:hypothetical protein
MADGLPALREPEIARRNLRDIMKERSPTTDEVRNVLVWGDSYERLPMLLEMLPHLSRTVLFEVLGENWQGFDNIGKYRLPLAKLLRSASRAELDLMMTNDEREALAAMPDEITVYRGCYQINRHGLSWSTDIGIAASFPTLVRYSRPGDKPLLLRAAAYRDRAVLKLDRDESEVIVWDPHEVRECSNAP